MQLEQLTDYFIGGDIMAYYQKKQKMGFNFSSSDLFQGVFDQYELGTELTKRGRIVKAIYSSKESTYRVYEVEDDGRRFMISGKFPLPLQLDGYYEIKGRVGEHNGKRQLLVSSYQSSMPATGAGIITLLTTLPGLDTKAAQLYDMFGNDVLEIIKEDPELVSEKVKGVSLSRAKIWQQHLLNNEKSEDGMKALLGYGLTARRAAMLLEKYGAAIIDKIKEDPYFLIQEIPSFSFIKCDALAMRNGCKADDLSRITQAMIYMMKREAITNGHCYLPIDEFINKTMKVINMTLTYRDAQRLIKSSDSEDIRVVMGNNKATLSHSALQQAMDEWQAGTKRESFYFPIFDVPMDTVKKDLQLLSGKTFIIEEVAGEERCYLRHYYDCERLITKTIRLMSDYSPTPFTQVEQIIDRLCKKDHITLEAKQYEAVRSICNAPGGIHILTGSAGCGKTFTLNIIIKVLRELYKDLYKGRPFEAKILAPTGKAAKVANQATKLPASTIHMALGLTTDGSFSKTVNGDVIIIDEFSMVDVSLAAELFASISPISKLIILGDQQQLPSIGPGLILRDLIDSGKIPTTVLNVVKRQGANSGILVNANKIIAGESIHTEANTDSLEGNSYIIEQTSPELCRKLTIDSVKKMLRYFPLGDVQVLCPQHAGDIGTDVLNLFLQQELNPAEGGVEVLNKNVKYKIDGIEHEEALNFRAGDKVIHIKNNYNMVWYKECGDFFAPIQRKGIINGEMGVIYDIKKEGKKTTIIVQYDGGFVFYEDDFSELTHAYALTIHKAQGSQWAAVITPILNSNRIMLNKNLFYTMFTRAQHVNVVIGDSSAMDYAIQNNQPQMRYTGLPVFLTSAF